jgi:hypothetical protein
LDENIMPIYSSGDFGALAIFVGLVFIIIALIGTITVGVLYGAGISIYNYALALNNNIKLERTTA